MLITRPTFALTKAIKSIQISKEDWKKKKCVTEE